MMSAAAMVNCMFHLACPVDTMICGKRGVTERKAAESASRRSGTIAGCQCSPSSASTKTSATSASPMAAGNALPEDPPDDREVGVAVEVPGDPRHHDVPAECHLTGDRGELARPRDPMGAPGVDEARAGRASDDRPEHEGPVLEPRHRERQRSDRAE